MMQTNIRWMVTCASCAAVLAFVVAPLTVRAQAGGKTKRQAAVRTAPGAERPPREVILVGRVVSVHAYMTNQSGEDGGKVVMDGLRAGGPAALETAAGLIVLGQGNTGGLRILLPLANEQVEVHGRIYEKGGVKFLDFDTVRAVPAEEEEAEEEEEEAGDE